MIAAVYIANSKDVKVNKYDEATYKLLLITVSNKMEALKLKSEIEQKTKIQRMVLKDVKGLKTAFDQEVNYLNRLELDKSKHVKYKYKILKTGVWEVQL